MILKYVKCSTGEVVKNYNDYLRTIHWTTLRLKKAKEQDNRCIRCDRYLKNGYQIHHITYKNIGHEGLSDLAFCCSECHEEIHLEKKAGISKKLQVKKKKKKRKKKNVENKIASSPRSVPAKNYKICIGCGFNKTGWCELQNVWASLVDKKICKRILK